MVNENWLIDVFHRRDVTNTDKLLVVLLDDQIPNKSTAEIRQVCIDHGLNKARDWNIPTYLRSAQKQGKVGYIKEQWKLTETGRNYLVEKALTPPNRAVLIKARNDVRSYLGQISNPDTQKFVEETIRCLEASLLRSAVVMSWVGATAILYDYVVIYKLAAFNSEARRRNAKWKDAVDADGLGEMKEYDFLQILETINVIGKNVKQALEQCLKYRNGCGHPNSYQIGEQIVAAHIETLILNVYAKF